MWNTFFDDPIRRRDVRPAKSPVPERPQREQPTEPEQPGTPQQQPEREPVHVPA